LAAKKPGRPRTRGVFEGERVPLGLRVTADVKAKLDQAIAASGRSQSQEAEFRIEQSFAEQRSLLEALDLAYGRELAWLMLWMGEVMKDSGRLAGLIASGTLEGAQNWFSNPYAFAQAVESAKTMLEAISPAGDPTAPQTSPIKVDGISPIYFGATAQRIGADTAKGILREIAGEKSGPPGDTERPQRLRKAPKLLVDRARQFIERST
jgi:hypothetical protein